MTKSSVHGLRQADPVWWASFLTSDWWGWTQGEDFAQASISVMKDVGLLLVSPSLRQVPVSSYGGSVRRPFELVNHGPDETFILTKLTSLILLPWVLRRRFLIDQFDAKSIVSLWKENRRSSFMKKTKRKTYGFRSQTNSRIKRNRCRHRCFRLVRMRYPII